MDLEDCFSHLPPIVNLGDADPLPASTPPSPPVHEAHVICPFVQQSKVQCVSTASALSAPVVDPEATRHIQEILFGGMSENNVTSASAPTSCNSPLRGRVANTEIFAIAASDGFVEKRGKRKAEKMTNKNTAATPALECNINHANNKKRVRDMTAAEKREAGLCTVKCCTASPASGLVRCERHRKQGNARKRTERQRHREEDEDEE